MSLFFVSDTHFNHYSSIKYSEFRHRFSTVDEMNDGIIKAWNAKVSPSDIVFHLGDVGWTKPAETVKLLNRLNGLKFLIIGNHDEKLVKYLTKNPEERCFEGIYPYREIKLEGTLTVLMHYPIYSWNRSHYGSIHLHGHCHGQKGENYPSGNILDVGIDTREDLSPYSQYEILQSMK